MCPVPSAPGRAASENGRLCHGDGPPRHASPLGTGLDISIKQVAEMVVDELGKARSLIAYSEDRPGQVQRHIAGVDWAASPPPHGLNVDYPPTLFPRPRLGKEARLRRAARLDAPIPFTHLHEL